MLTIVVCVGSSCYVRGSERVAETFERLISSMKLDAQVELTGAYCMERCSMGVSVRVGERSFTNVQPDQAEELFHAYVLPVVEERVVS